MDYEKLTAELDRVFPIGGEVVTSEVKEYSFEDAVKEISKAYQQLETEKAWLSFIEESVCSEEDDVLGWTLGDARRTIGYAQQAVEMAIEKAYNAGRLF